MRLLFVVGRAALHVGTEAARPSRTPACACRGNAQRLVALRGLVEHLQRDVERQFVGRHAVGHAGAAFALLQERPVAADADENSALRPRAGPMAMRLTSRASISSTLFASCCFSPAWPLPK